MDNESESKITEVGAKDDSGQVEALAQRVSDLEKQLKERNEKEVQLFEHGTKSLEHLANAVLTINSAMVRLGIVENVVKALCHLRLGEADPAWFKTRRNAENAVLFHVSDEWEKAHPENTGIRTVERIF